MKNTGCILRFCFTPISSISSQMESGVTYLVMVFPGASSRSSLDLESGSRVIKIRNNRKKRNYILKPLKFWIFHKFVLLTSWLASRSNTSIVLAVVDLRASTRPVVYEPTPRAVQRAVRREYNEKNSKFNFLEVRRGSSS